MLNHETRRTQNRPIEKLKTEHALIGKVLDAFDRWAEALLLEGKEDRLTLKRFLSFLTDFVDGAHHIKEEKVLFAVMKKHGFSGEEGPIAVMCHEHEEARALMRDLAKLATQSEAWDKENCRDINNLATTYVTLHRNHIEKEDYILYPLAERRLPAQAWKEIAEAFADIDEENECSGMYDENVILAAQLMPG
jgi:hemerythrin-like domain-containing protein